MFYLASKSKSFATNRGKAPNAGLTVVTLATRVPSPKASPAQQMRPRHSETSKLGKLALFFVRPAATLAWTTRTIS